MTIKQLIAKHGGSLLIVHFIDVGDGDCTLINHPSGRLTLVDIDDTAYWQGSFYNTVSLIQYLYMDKVIFRYIQTHPDLDHMGGLYALKNEVGITNFWDVPNTKRLNKEDFDHSPHDWNDWRMYRQLARGLHDDTRLLTHIEGATGSYWSEDGISTFGPTQEEVDAANRAKASNPLSRILKVRHGAFSLLLCGDAEESNLARLEREYESRALDSSVLRAAHHGRNSGICEDCLTAVQPYYTIISAGKPTDHDASEVYEEHSIDGLLRTQEYGTLTLLANRSGSFWIFDDEGILLRKRKF